MHIAFVVPYAYRPELVTGGIMDIHHTALQMQALGHDVEVLATRQGGRRLLPYRLRQRLTPGLIVKVDHANGYPTRRVGAAMLMRLLGHRLADSGPDVIVTQGLQASGVVASALARGIPAIVNVVALNEIEHLAGVAQTDPTFAADLHHPLVHVVTNSAFMAANVTERLGVHATVIYPCVDRDVCVADDQRPTYVTLFNPGLNKGQAIALEAARLLPHREFLLIDGWLLGGPERADLQARLRELPNVRLEPSTLDVTEVYSRTALLLAPSQWEEAFGRVVLEAAANGIPQVASRIGGLPEAAGPGAVLLEPTAPAAEWARAIESLLGDEKHYEEMAALALEHSGQPAFDPEAIAQQFLGIAAALQTAARSAHAPAGSVSD